jgi:hypothetical protein
MNSASKKESRPENLELPLIEPNLSLIKNPKPSPAAISSIRTEKKISTFSSLSIACQKTQNSQNLQFKAKTVQLWENGKVWRRINKQKKVQLEKEKIQLTCYENGLLGDMI